ncbi:GNAT family N-acetyltransferase [Marihabitans asiaticum]|uniref:RimJ/RimL family protein N-acetyltransferase n=1 Tax=Marihabitans asiaticum TaxID=415218 RepID=A0A560WGG1_9MICO|nr:GNAT family N-acetyltransferase [Marihabitans asiaticum]TWD16769.1 RimJ/RimL family protein N-acetyltransferase [Marihabitans asiaticum]
MIPLRTERLRLRPFTEADAPFVLAGHQSEGLRRFIPSQVLDDPSEVPARIERFQRFDDDPVLGVVAVERLADGAPVGLVMLQPIPPSEGVDRADIEIGWRGHPEHAGRGYITEAAATVLDHALATLPRVLAVTHPDNVASQAVCRRIGMADRGLTDDYYDEPGVRLFVIDSHPEIK